ncbi:LPS export ABC transporter periplasmic protein LptC [Desulfonatronum thioautotrophicum]|uniref:LPS export ABC transporter periplasmic protein LptC n=1 Tax=Desulfonatronum thioautotrophicum TaxID=617001 RepID=UPI000699675E|nr:LPS export ABC transporter periplasmic protein LptC [Desulfonatronum thioautotrophicum]
MQSKIALKVFLGGGILLLLLGVSVFFGESGQEQRTLDHLAENADVDVSMSGVEMRLGQEGRTLWTLRARSASYDQGQQMVLLNAPSIIKNLDGRDIPIIVNAPLGEVDQATNDIRLWSGVHMEYGPTYLNSREAIFIQVDETIFLHGDIFLDRQGLQLRSERGDVDLHTWVVNAEGGVEVIIANDGTAQGL